MESKRTFKRVEFRSYNELKIFVVRHYKTLVPFISLRKGWNISVSLIEMKLRKVVCRSKPFVYRVDPCSLCNLQCPSCSSHNSIFTKTKMLSLDRFKQVVEKIERWAVRISLYDAGEPLLNPNIYRMIKFASLKNISTSISSNFNAFSKANVAALFESKLTVLEPCLDGFTQENYSKYRVGGNVQIVKDGIQLVMDEKRRRKSKFPIVDVQIILFDHILNEIHDIFEFLNECKVDKVTCRQECYGFGADKGNKPNKVQGRQSNCFWLYMGMVVSTDGDIFPCSGSVGGLSFGNIYESDISEIWNNKMYRFSRSLFQKGAAIKCDSELAKSPCIKCEKFLKLRTTIPLN